MAQVCRYINVRHSVLHILTPSSLNPDMSTSLEEARRVIWPFDTRQPMGLMLDQGTLTRSKLQWAAEKAKWPDVRRAAQRLIEELDSPSTPQSTDIQPPAQAMLNTSQLSTPLQTPAAAAEPLCAGSRIITASTYLGYQEILHGWLLFYYSGLGTGLALTTLTTLLWLLRGQATWLTVLSLTANLVLWSCLAVLISRRRRTRRNYLAGRKGEDRVVEQLGATLDQRWTIYRNLQLPARKDDLDVILTGPGGVWAVQVKAYSVPLRVRAGVWEYQRGRNWLRCGRRFDPATQVTRQATLLNEFLKSNGIRRFVERAIALAEPQPFDRFTTSDIPIWLPFNVAQQAAALATRYPPSDEELARINDLLSTRASQQRAQELHRRGR
jgi:hypothetical protein